MNRHIISIIIVLILMSCILIGIGGSSSCIKFQYKRESEVLDTFNLFSNQFKDVNLPINLDEIFLLDYVPENLEIDTLFVKKFIKENNIIDHGISLFNLYKYYPVGKFVIDINKLGIIYLQVGGAGGRNEQYFLNVYDNQGHTLYSILLAKLIADCSFKYFLCGKVNQNLLISFTERKYSVNCPSEKQTLESEYISDTLINL